MPHSKNALDEAAEYANNLTAQTTKTEPKMSEEIDETQEKNEKPCYINFRINSSDFERLGNIAVKAHISRSGLCKMAAIAMADFYEDGLINISAGGIRLRRK
jgi:hypothetical protein